MVELPPFPWLLRSPRSCYVPVAVAQPCLMPFALQAARKLGLVSRYWMAFLARKWQR